MISNMFALRDSIMESASGYTNDVDPFKFMDETTCFNEANTIISETMNDITTFSYEAQSLIIENASNPRIDVLTEGFFATLAEKIKKFFEAMKKVFLGVYDRIRAFVAKLTGNTAKWLQIMTPRIKAKKTATGIDELEAEMLSPDLGNFAEKSTSKFILDEYDKLYEKCKRGGIVDGRKYEEVNKDDIVEADTKKFISSLISMYGISSTAETVDEFISDLSDAIFGNTETVKVAAKSDELLELIKNSNKFISVASDDYKKVISAIDTCKRNMDSMASKLKSNDKAPDVKYYAGLKEGNDLSSKDPKSKANFYEGDETKKLRTNLAATFEAYSTVCSNASKCFNSQKNIVVKYVKKAVNDAMNALTKMAYFKEKRSS